ncbi:MAG: hypothetical protein HWE34_19010 [Methylocystaceae bacterium]|nr:hypothetical protein [Methylocystaceae bacterium]
MSTVAPPPPPLPPTALGSAAQLTVTVTSGQAAIQLSQQALDSLINGLIKAPTTQGLTTVQTDFGPIQFKSPFALPADAQATFKLVQTQPNVQIQLTHINGKPIPTNTPINRVATLASQFSQASTPGGAAGFGNAGTQNQWAGTISSPATTLNLNTANGLKAFVLNTPSPIGNAQPGLGNTTTSNPQTTQLQTSQSGLQSSPVPSQSTKPTPLMGQTSTQTAGVPTTNTGHFQPGNQLTVRLLSVQLPGQTVTTTGTPSTHNAQSTVIIQGTVQGQTPTHQPIIKLPQGLIALDVATKMPEGTSVKLEVLSSTKPATPAAIHTTQQQGDMQALTQKWPALDEALKTLQDINPALADRMSHIMIPKPDTRLAMNMIFFLRALGVGNFKNWADTNSMKILSRIKPGLLNQLEEEFQSLSKKAKQPNATDWKIAYVPMQNNNEINQIRIAQRDHRDDGNEGKEDPGVRFVIDIELSRLGEMQLDGLAKEKAKNFDLIIRTKSALPGFMRKTIHDIFESGMKSINFNGHVNFRVTSRFVEIEGVDLTKELNLGMLV